jgi:hypothetical protein
MPTQALNVLDFDERYVTFPSSRSPTPALELVPVGLELTNLYTHPGRPTATYHRHYISVPRRSPLVGLPIPSKRTT